MNKLSDKEKVHLLENMHIGIDVGNNNDGTSVSIFFFNKDRGLYQVYGKVYQSDDEIHIHGKDLIEVIEKDEYGVVSFLNVGEKGEKDDLD